MNSGAFRVYLQRGCKASISSIFNQRKLWLIQDKTWAQFGVRQRVTSSESVNSNVICIYVIIEAVRLNTCQGKKSTEMRNNSVLSHMLLPKWRLKNNSNSKVLGARFYFLLNDLKTDTHHSQERLPSSPDSHWITWLFSKGEEFSSKIYISRK